MITIDRYLARRGKTISIENRAMKIINGGATEIFTAVTSPLALIKTLRGVKVFDSTNTERVATHEIKLAFIAGITSEQWVKFGSKRIKILTVENCCEEDEVLILVCTERGDEGKVVNEG